jgi:hypothetical protein
MIDFIAHVLHRLAEFGTFVYWTVIGILGLSATIALALLVSFAIAQLRRFGRWLRKTIRKLGRALQVATGNAIAGLVGLAHDVAVREPGKRRLEVLFRGSADSVASAAASRRSRLRADGALTGAVLEVPPGYTRPREATVSRNAEAAREARSRWELGDDSLLLHGRVADAVRCIVDAGRTTEAANPVSFDVALRRRRWWEHRVAEHPSIVEIDIDDPSILREDLLRLREWLGVTVAFAKPMRFRLQKKCTGTCGGLKRGTIAGGVAVGANTFLLTCAHVPPPRCSQVRFQGAFESHADEPDVLVLDPLTSARWRSGGARFWSRRVRPKSQRCGPVERRCCASAGRASTRVASPTIAPRATRSATHRLPSRR